MSVGVCLCVLKSLKHTCIVFEFVFRINKLELCENYLFVFITKGNERMSRKIHRIGRSNISICPNIAERKAAMKSRSFRCRRHRIQNSVSLFGYRFRFFTVIQSEQSAVSPFDVNTSVVYLINRFTTKCNIIFQSSISLM